MITGRMRHVVDVQRRVPAQNTVGEESGAWVSMLQTRASIDPIGGKELHSSAGEYAKITTRIRMRWHPALAALKADDRVLHGTTVFDIKVPVNTLSANREWVLECIQRG